MPVGFGTAAAAPNPAAKSLSTPIFSTTYRIGTALADLLAGKGLPDAPASEGGHKR
jgi:hypothetical protein